MNIPSEINKITYDQQTNRYKIIFNEIGNLRTCIIDVVSSDAKNIALAKENITSSRLKTYNLILNLFSSLSIKIDKTIISKKRNTINSTIHLIRNNEKLLLDSNFVDSIILSLKSFSIIYLHDSLYSNIKSNISYEVNEDIIKVNIDKFMSDNAKVKRLKKTLDELIHNENYESAAIVRDRIFKISNKNKR